MALRLSVQDEAFQGPLHLLLALAERGDVDLEQMALAPLCERYLEEVRAVAPLPIEEIGEFLFMGARLVRLKLEEAWLGDLPEEALDLRTEMRLLEALEGAAAELRGRGDVRTFPRPDAVAPRTVPISGLALAMKRMAQRRKRLLPTPERTQRREGIRLETITRALQRRLEGGAFPYRPDEWPWGIRGMALFAALELAWRKHVTLEQASPFGELTIRPRENSL